MKKIEITALQRREGSGYPPPYDEPCRTRMRRALGDAGGLTQFGVNLLHLPPRSWSSQRHWHTEEDAFAWIVEGEVVLVTDAGEESCGRATARASRRGSPTATTCRTAPATRR